MSLNRIIITVKDVQTITGKSDRAAREILYNIRKKLGKKRHQFVSIGEFSTYTGLPEAEVWEHLAIKKTR